MPRIFAGSSTAAPKALTAVIKAHIQRKIRYEQLLGICFLEATLTEDF
jgi:hypothetical protein